MRFFSTLLAISVSSERVALQQKSNFGYGTEISFGTPQQTLFVAPDFASPLTRLFVGPSVRQPFFPPIAESTSALATEAVPVGSPRDGERTLFADKVTIGGIEVADVVVSREIKKTAADTFDIGDSQGRIALGPTSRIAQTKIIKLEPEMLSFADGKRTGGSSIELLAAVPAIAGGEKDVVLEMADRTDGWITDGRFVVGAESVSGAAAQQIEFDPTANGIEVPNSAVDRLTTLLSMFETDAYLDATGRFMLSCSPEGRLTLGKDLFLELAGGHRVVLYVVREVPIDQVQANPRTGRHSCPSQIRVRMVDSSGRWKLNPLLIAGAASVFLNGHGRQMTLRFYDPETGPVAKADIPAVPMPRVPLFGKFTIHKAADEDTIVFAATDRDESVRNVQYAIGSLEAVKRSDGSLLFGFIRAKGDAFLAPKTLKIGDGYVIESGNAGLEIVDQESLNLRLRLKKESGAAGKKYSLMMMQQSHFMAFVLVPQ